MIPYPAKHADGVSLAFVISLIQFSSREMKLDDFRFAKTIWA